MRIFFCLIGAVLLACASSSGEEDTSHVDDVIAEVEEHVEEPQEDVAFELSDEEYLDLFDSGYADPVETETVEQTDCKAASGSYSMLAGVKIEFTTERCSWFVYEALDGIEIPYRLVVEADVPFVKPKPQDVGGCGKPGESGLILFEELAGGQSRYCLCDVGLCPQPSDEPITVKKGVYPGVFIWDGLNWEGPSDTNKPKGKPFPPGRYTLTVSAKGQAKLFGGTTYQDFEVSATWPVELKPNPKPEEEPEVVADIPMQDYYIPAPDATPPADVPLE